MDRSRHLQGFLIFAAIVAIGGLFVWQNTRPAIVVSVPAATPTPIDAPQDNWQAELEAQLAREANTPIPTPELDVTAYVPPTLPPPEAETIIEPVDLQSTPWDTPTPWPTAAFESQTAGGPTAYPSPTGVFVPQEPAAVAQYQPPPEQVPLSAHADDHFWFMRPVDASANSQSLFYYPFGSNGPQDEWRVHHGVDMPNPVGEPIQAGGSGTVIWAGSDAQVLEPNSVEIYPSYGNVVIIEHDFGYRGQKVWTLYAHMSAVLVERGQHVEAGDIIGLIGGTGDVSGPHVHLEVRVGQNNYFAVHNPLLWIAPYVGHGVVAGRVVFPDGRYVDDAVVTLSRRGRVIETTTTYVQPYGEGLRTWHVSPDPAWRENFVLGDVPEGEYQITASLGDIRVSRTITVRAGTTNFIVLGIEPAGTAATPQPVDDDDAS